MPKGINDIVSIQGFIQGFIQDFQLLVGNMSGQSFYEVPLSRGGLGAYPPLPLRNFWIRTSLEWDIV